MARRVLRRYHMQVGNWDFQSVKFWDECICRFFSFDVSDDICQHKRAYAQNCRDFIQVNRNLLFLVQHLADQFFSALAYSVGCVLVFLSFCSRVCDSNTVLTDVDWRWCEAEVVYAIRGALSCHFRKQVGKPVSVFFSKMKYAHFRTLLSPGLDWPLCYCAMAPPPSSTNTGAWPLQMFWGHLPPGNVVKCFVH